MSILRTAARAAFLAILGEEEGRLLAIPALFETLRREIG